MVSSKDPAEHVDGLMLLGVFLDNNKESINWDGFMTLFLEVMSFIPSGHTIEGVTMHGASDNLLLWDAACFCICRMCAGSPIILEQARSLHAVPRILCLVKYVTSNGLQTSFSKICDSCEQVRRRCCPKQRVSRFKRVDGVSLGAEACVAEACRHSHRADTAAIKL